MAGRYSTKLDLIILMAWLAKDMSWVLLATVPGLIAAMSAISVQVHVLLLGRDENSTLILVHEVAGLFWLFGNALWMVCELGFEHRSEGIATFPWHEGPFLAQNPQAYTVGLLWCRALFAFALFILLAFYARCLYLYMCGLPLPVSVPAPARGTSGDPQPDAQGAPRLPTHCADNPQDVEMEVEESQRKTMERRTSNASVASSVEREEEDVAEVWGLFTIAEYSQLFLGPWILKDLFWTYEWLMPGSICSVVCMALLVDCLRRRSCPAMVVVELLWVAANTLWIVDELLLKDLSRLPRCFAAGMLAIGIHLAFTEFYRLDWSRPRRQHAAAGSETTSLLRGERTVVSST
eukprot:TRINITY_DN14293_c0_g1_i2.p1 TRINITY_DN14293_c0_g1~~TRINITY_DN14293_c0_g1_i2.p1  ORF type:complete len:378 (+),score=42.55 TRINITY_DN14293_c0_g1_i2:88-1134(+)